MDIYDGRKVLTLLAHADDGCFACTSQLFNLFRTFFPEFTDEWVGQVYKEETGWDLIWWADEELQCERKRTGLDDKISKFLQSLQD